MSRILRFPEFCEFYDCPDDSSLSIKSSSNISPLFNQFNSFSSGNIVNFNYYDIDQLQTLKFPEEKQIFILFHINTCSLNKNFGDLLHLLKCTNNVFDVVAVYEIRIMEKTSSSSNIQNNYSFGLTSTECTTGGTLLVVNHLSYKPHNNLNLYKVIQLEFFYWNTKFEKR